MTVRARTPVVERTPDGTDRLLASGSAGPAASGPTPVRPPPTDELVERARAAWRAALVDETGDSALADVDRLSGALLDLSAAHPSGIAQLFAGRTTRLSNLVREGSALSAAKRRARAVASRADDYAQRYGLASAFLAIGVATWTEELTPEGDASDDDARPAGPGEPTGAEAAVPDVAVPDAAVPDVAVPHAAVPGQRPAPAGAPTRTLRAPVLLRPVTVRARRGEPDLDLTLEPSIEVNPLLAIALRRTGALLDPAALARGTFAPTGFDPRQALDRLRGLGEALLADFRLDDRVLVGTFVHPEQSLVDDLDALAGDLAEHEVIAALAGDERAVAAIAHPLPPRLAGDRPPDEERGVGDLDPAQTHVLDALSAGHHLLVDAPPGSDAAGTIAAAVADAVAAGRTVLYVAGHRRAADALNDRLAALGLADAVLDVAPQSGWRELAGQRLLGAMTVDPVPVDGGKVTIVERELEDRRSRLQRYIAALHARREPWGASAYDALQALARLTAARPTPRTRVRLTPAVAEALGAENRAQAAADLVRVATLGAFTTAIRGSAWYGADLPTPDRARAAVQRVDQLLDHGLPQMREQALRVAEETGLIPATSPAEWAEQLHMLAGVRAALDVFRPLVFERSAADLVAATAGPAWREAHGVEMSGSLRRRLHKQAKDMLRPGRPVADLHGALVQVQEQREIWRAHCPAGGWPRIPEGLGGIEADHRHARADLDALSAVLVATPDGGDLAGLPWADLEVRLARLRTDRAALDTLPERTALVRSLDRRGLAVLLADLADRRVPATVVAAELDLAWWSTVFEQILTEDPALAGRDGATLTRLVAEFRALDERFLLDRAVLARAAAREAVHARMRAADAQTQELFGEIVEGRFASVRQAIDRYPQVARHLRPCLVASPMLVPHLLPPRRTEDLVVLDAATHLPLEEVVPALARGRQVLVVGDTRCAVGSALTALASVLPAITLTAQASRRDPHLTAFLAANGYRHHLRPTPLPSEAGLLRLEVVDGAGMPAENGLVEGTQAEVARVAELVAEHARTRADRSLAVVSASSVHADRVRDAVAALTDDPTVARFLADPREPFAVVELGATQGLLRDDVILSLGFGRTPHGRVLHRFGRLTEPGGDIALLEALATLRERLTMVTCFRAVDLDADRLRTPGGVLLAELLELAAARSTPDAGRPRPAPHAGPAPDRLVLDLAERLWRAGLLVDVDHATGGGERIPLVVGHPDLPDRMLVAVLTDDDAYVGEPSVRVRDRQLPQRLERLGWTVVQVWSAAAFLDPQGEAAAIVEVVLEARRRFPGGAVEGAGAAVLTTDGDTATPAGADAVSPTPGDAVPPAAEVVAPAGPAPRGPRPAVEPGLPIAAYTDDQLDELAAWICTDGLAREDDELAAALRAELGITRRGVRIDTAVAAAVRRARE